MAELAALLNKIEDGEVKKVLRKYKVRIVDDVTKKLRSISSSIKDTESGNGKLKSFMKEVRAVTYDIENAIDNFLVKEAKNLSRKCCKYWLIRKVLLGVTKRTSFLKEFRAELDKINTKLDSLDAKLRPDVDGAKATDGDMGLPSSAQLQPDVDGAKAMDDDIELPASAQLQPDDDGAKATDGGIELPASAQLQPVVDGANATDGGIELPASAQLQPIVDGTKATDGGIGLPSSAQLQPDVDGAKATDGDIGLPASAKLQPDVDSGKATDGDMGFPASAHLQPDDVHVVGSTMKKEFKSIINLLLDEKTNGLSTVSIIGQDGLGKTNLARVAYNSDYVKIHFDVRIWVAVSPRYVLLDLLKIIANQLHICSPLESVGLLDQLIRDSLRGKKYLLVLDDIPSDDLWTRMKPILPDKEKGSRVLITTRQLLASTGNDPACELEPLTDEQSQKLLQKISGLNKEPENDLTNIFNQLATNCKGYPLALVLLGGYLSKVPQTYASWINLLATEKFVVEGSSLENILSSCYDALSFTLQSCFSYFAVFPQNYEIDAGSLIRMWVAEDFISQEKNKTMEETAAHFLEDLVQRRMVQVSRRSIHDGAIISCRIHNLLHDFAVRKAQEENLLLTICSSSCTSVSHQPRRLAVHHSGCSILTEEKIRESLRSLLYFEPIPKFSSYKLLKVLGDMRGTAKEGLENGSSMEFAQLRYCELGSLDSKIMAKFTSEMKYLQTLDLRRGKHGDLPDSIWGVKVLRHVMLSGYTLGPTSEAELTNLQTLTGVKTRKSWESKLPKIHNVRKLDIKLDGVFPWEQIAIFLASLEYLISLRLLGTDDVPLIIIDMRSFPFYQRLKSLYLLGDTPFPLEANMFPINLAELTLDYFRLRQDPFPVLEKLSILKRLCLYNAFEIRHMRCSAGGFKMLEELRMFWLENLETWEIENGAMPVLKELTVTNCHLLHTLTGLKHLKNLQNLNLSGASLRGHEVEIFNDCKDNVAFISINDLVGLHGVIRGSVKDEEDAFEDAKTTSDGEDASSENN